MTSENCAYTMEGYLKLLANYIESVTPKNIWKNLNGKTTVDKVINLVSE